MSVMFVSHLRLPVRLALRPLTPPPPPPLATAAGVVLHRTDRSMCLLARLHARFTATALSALPALSALGEWSAGKAAL